VMQDLHEPGLFWIQVVTAGGGSVGLDTLPEGDYVVDATMWMIPWYGGPPDPIDVGSTSFSVIPGPATLAGDANGNGFVDHDDLAILLANWEQDPAVLADRSLGDFTDNTDVDEDDLAVLLANWTGPPVGIAVPEPATLSLLALGGLAVVRRRRIRIDTQGR